MYIRIYICIPVHGRFKGFNWGITTRLVYSYTPVVTFDLLVIPQWLLVIPQWLVVIRTPAMKNSKLYNQLLKKCVTTTIVAHIKANTKAGIQASYITLHS